MRKVLIMKKAYIGVSLLIGLVSVDAQKKQGDSLGKESKIDEIELFGEKKKQPRGMEIITRLPLKPRDQIQSISIISHKAIEEMGALTITDAAKNIPGVALFSNYGGGAESMSIRGYRGTPTLKNGVLMNSDFRTSSMIADMQGIESIQVIRGSAAITQGIGNALGAAGGVINLVTKTPRFYNATNVGFRYGSWDMYRPTVDFQRVLDNQGKVAVRFNAAYQNNKSYVDYVEGERIYINPSVAFRPDDKTSIIAEMDYLHNERTPNQGTVNLAANDTYAIYDMPKNKFLGFASDKALTKSFSYMITAERKLSDKFKLRAAYMSSDNSNDSETTSLAAVRGQGYEMRERRKAKGYSEDRSKVFQFDFIGQEVKTGFLKHTFQVGFDWKESETFSDAYGYTRTVNGQNQRVTYVSAGVIDVTQDVNNILPSDVNVGLLQLLGRTYTAKNPSVGLMAQEVMHIGKYVKAIMGVRYSSFNGPREGQKDAWNPSFGLMIAPRENINVYGSYTNTTDLRTVNRVMINGGTAGPSVTRQWEAGIKSDWFDEKLRFNINLYSMDMNNLTYEVRTDPNIATNLYEFAGDLTRKGVEIDLIGKLLPQLEVMAGYAYLDAKYKNTPAFVEGSAPMMAAKHTANGWLNYTVKEGVLKGLNFGGGVYYIGERPVNDHTQTVISRGHENDAIPGVAPFYLKAYTTINAQVGYTYKNMGIRVFANNLTDSIGYSAYFRGGYLNRTDPRNFAVQLNYKF